MMHCELGPRPGELLMIRVQPEASFGTLLPDALTEKQKNESEWLLFGSKPAPSSYKGIVPRLHVVDKCGTCGGTTPHCSRCGASWCLDCESSVCGALYVGSKRPRAAPPSNNPPDAA